jgi:hypothetical protein
MKVIRNKSEFIEFYGSVYSSNFDPKPEPKPEKCPKSYPCICDWEWRGGGLAGEYRHITIVGIPRNCDESSFIKGYKKGFAMGEAAE